MPGFDHRQPFHALLSDFTQDTHLLRLTTPLWPDRLLAECVRGEEGIGDGFRFAISALSTDARIPLTSLIGQPALLELLTNGAPRPFHGHVTQAALAGANSGFARYHLTVEPWTAFLGRGRDSRLFPSMNMFDILDEVFSAYRGRGTLAPAWRFDILDSEIYPVHSLCIQYQESDFAFALRLMHEEGLFFYFEHSGAPSGPALGSHTMVIADHNGVFEPNAQARVAYARPGPTMREDSLDRWRTETRLQTNAVELSSWGYRARDLRQVAATSSSAATDRTLTVRDVPGAYAYPSRAQGQRLADNILQALEAGKERHTGAGTVRTLAPGTTFTLTGHARTERAAGDAERTFLAVRVVHLMNNNLSAELRTALASEPGQSNVGDVTAREACGNLHGQTGSITERPLYRVRADAVRSDLPYRHRAGDGRGGLLHARPRVQGQQTALVVGPPGSTVHTDRDHRIEVQFHWQRGSRSHSRIPNGGAGTRDGVRADDRLAAWVRVATPMAPVAGAKWGSAALPRVGQEVLVDFLDGDIERPVVVGTLYNGRGRADAQHNQVVAGGGSATGNAPAWFPGNAGAHAHPAAPSGVKSQAMAASQDGGGAYSQLVFDDSAGQARLSLQHHARAHTGTAELNLGYLRHQTDNQRLASVGLGVELKTQHGAAVRAGKGLLLSTESGGGAGHQLAAAGAVGQIEQSIQLQAGLTDLARKHQALKPVGGDELPATLHPMHTAKVLRNVATGPAADHDADSADRQSAIAFSEPHLQLSSPAGIVAVTPANAILASGSSGALSAGQDVNLVAQGLPA